MTWPTDDPLRTRIAADLASTMAAILGGPTYRTTVARVYQLKGRQAFTVEQFPAIILPPENADTDDQRLGMLLEQLSFPLMLVVSDNNDPVKTMRDFIADLRVAVLADHTRGGLAVDTHITSDQPYSVEPTRPLYGADVTISVNYRHKRDDPSELP